MPATSAWPTVASAVSDAAVELGLASADVADPYASTNPDILLLVRLLKTGGREIVKRRLWTHLIKEYTFPLVNATASYVLPTDFRSMIDDTLWDRTTRLPVSMPTNSRDWQFLQAVPVAANIAYRSRIWLERLYIYPTPVNVTDTIAYEYNSSSWVAVTGSTTPTKDAPTLATDILCFESRLLVARLKRDYRRTRKQDSQSEEDDYQGALYDAENEDAQAKTLYIGGGSGRTPRKIDRWNLPDVIR